MVLTKNGNSQYFMDNLFTIPTPLDPLPNENQDRRLWVGNLDVRLNEYQLLKILQRFGHIEKFDLLFHRSGPQEGQPRGYAFITYKDTESALNAKTKLHGRKLGAKHVAVKWAHTINTDELDKAKPKINIPALAGAKKEPPASTSSKIEAIEAKLRLMEKSPTEGPDFTGQPLLSTQPPAWRNPIKKETVKGLYANKKRVLRTRTKH